MLKENLIHSRNEIRKEIEMFKNNIENKIKTVLRLLTKDQIANICNRKGYTITNNGDNCNIIEFIDNFEAVKLLPDYDDDESWSIILSFNEMNVTQLIAILDIAVLNES